LATTRLISHHISPGHTIAETLKDRFDYGKNPLKTLGGELIASYMCNPETVDAEFNVSKAEYLSITGRRQFENDVLCYQIRQSFKRGETDAETALKIGFDLAMRWTKGKHAFFVVSHIDRPHPHVHIYYNSTTLDCTRKFRDFHASAMALRHLSDRICLENNLSVVINPKLHSQGKYKHYGEWLGENKPVSFKERLKTAIDKVLLSHPMDLNGFLSLMNKEGFEYKWGRGGSLSFRIEGQKKFTRLRDSTLGNGYGLEGILAVIEGHTASPVPKYHQVNLIIDIQQKLKEGKGPAYARWASVFNLKQMAEALQYLQQNNLLHYDDLAAKTEASVERFHSAGDKLRVIESAMKRNSKLKTAIVDYARTRAVFEQYKAQKYSNKYLSEHEAEIVIHRAAKSSIGELLNGEKLPKIDSLKAEWESLKTARKSGYSEYRSARKEMREVITVKGNIDYLFGISNRGKNMEVER